VYNNLPRVDPTRSLDGSHGVSKSEQAVLRRQYREFRAAERAAERAQAADQHLAPSSGRRRITRPVSAIWGLVGTRR
jgi:hypothetical protein